MELNLIEILVQILNYQKEYVDGELNKTLFSALNKY